MATLQIRKKTNKTWLHVDSELGEFILSKFYFSEDVNKFQIVEQGESKRRIYDIINITVYDDSIGGSAESFTTIAELSIRLEQLLYPAFNNIAGVPASSNDPLATHFKGNYDVITNMPTLIDGVGQIGNEYVCTTSGIRDFGSGNITLNKKDIFAYNGATWYLKANNSQGISDEIIEIGDISVLTTPNRIKIDVPPDGSWRINGIIYTESSINEILITDASVGMFRKDIIVAATTGYSLVQGVESSSNPFSPTVPIDSILVTEVLVFENGIDEITPPITGDLYIEKKEKAQINDISTGVIDYTFLDNKAVVSFTDSVTVLQTVNIDSTTDYENKKYTFKNNQIIPITIKHLSGVGLGGHKFFFPNEVDFTLNPNEIVEFLQAKTFANGLILEYIGTSLDDDILDALSLKQTVFTGIDQEQYLTENDIVFDNTALTLTIATVKNGVAISVGNPVVVFTDGIGIAVKHTKITPVVFTFTNTTGAWYFYFDSSGTPIATQTAPLDSSTIAKVYRVYWNSTLPIADKRVIESFECYRNYSNWSDRDWKDTQGAQYASGLNISSNALASGVPASDGSNAVVLLTTGAINDSALAYTITNASSGTVKFTQDLGSALLPATAGKFICITNNASGVLDKIPATNFPFLWNAGTNTPEYLTTLGVRTAVGNNNFFVYYIYALQDPRRGETIKIKSAEVDFSTAILADAHNWAQLQSLFPTLRDGKIRLLYKITFEYRSSYDVGSKKSVLRKVEDLRRQRIITSGTLSGTLPASNVTFSPAGDIVATNVQSALQELDTEKQKVLTSGTNIKTVSGTSLLGSGDLVSLVTNSTVTGTYNLDFSKDTFELILTGNTTFSVSNLPTGTTKVISVYVTGNYAITYPSGFTTRILGAYDGTKNNQIIIEYRGTTNAYWVTINQAL
jgi:hypothetical protein